MSICKDSGYCWGGGFCVVVLLVIRTLGVEDATRTGAGRDDMIRIGVALSSALLARDVHSASALDGAVDIGIECELNILIWRLSLLCWF
jgi:hypothetical protein